MPFESESQRRWMWANEPEMAKRWEEHTPKGKKLPKRKKKEEKDAEAESPLQALLRAKAYSDARNYAAKQALMRKLIRERQEEFEIDSDKDGIAGITHVPTGFRMHLPKKALTGFDLMGREDFPPGEKVANRAIPDCIDVDWNDREAKGSRNPNDVLWDIPQPSIYIQESKQHGKGTHAAKTIKKGDYACIGLVGMKWRTPACRYINHSPDNNVELEWSGKLGMFRATQDIEPGAELLLDYRELPWYELTVKAAEEKPRMGVLHEVTAELIKKASTTPGDAQVSQGGFLSLIQSLLHGFGQVERPQDTGLAKGMDWSGPASPDDAYTKYLMQTGQLSQQGMGNIMSGPSAPGELSPIGKDETPDSFAERQGQHAQAQQAHEAWEAAKPDWAQAQSSGSDYNTRAGMRAWRSYSEMGKSAAYIPFLLKNAAESGGSWSSGITDWLRSTVGKVPVPEPARPGNPSEQGSVVEPVTQVREYVPGETPGDKPVQTGHSIGGPSTDLEAARERFERVQRASMPDPVGHPRDVIGFTSQWRPHRNLHEVFDEGLLGRWKTQEGRGRTYDQVISQGAGIPMEQVHQEVREAPRHPGFFAPPAQKAQYAREAIEHGMREQLEPQVQPWLQTEEGKEQAALSLRSKLQTRKEHPETGEVYYPYLEEFREANRNKLLPYARDNPQNFEQVLALSGGSAGGGEAGDENTRWISQAAARDPQLLEGLVEVGMSSPEHQELLFNHLVKNANQGGSGLPQPLEEHFVNNLSNRLDMDPEASRRYVHTVTSYYEDMLKSEDPEVRKAAVFEVMGRGDPSPEHIQRLKDRVANDPYAKERLTPVVTDLLTSTELGHQLLGEREPMGMLQAFSELLGPAGMAGGLMFLFGLLGGNKAFTLAGLGAMAGFGAYRGHQMMQPEFQQYAFSQGASPEAKRRMHAALSLRRNLGPAWDTTKGWAGQAGNWVQGASGKEVTSSDKISDTASSWAVIRAPTIQELTSRDKLAAVLGPGRFGPGAVTQFGVKDRSSAVEQRLQQHFPAEYARQTIGQDPHISFADKVKILSAVNETAGGPEEKGAIRVRDFLPTVIGAGIGYAGARAVAGMLGLPPSMDKAIRATGAIAGALLNEPRVRW